MGQNYSNLLVRSFDGARLELLHLLAYQAALLKMPLYLVGGVVRDILLGRAVNDFDLVVDGSSAEFAEYIVRKFGGKILIHAKFMTATWVLNEVTFERLQPTVGQFTLPASAGRMQEIEMRRLWTQFPRRQGSQQGPRNIAWQGVWNKV